MWPGYNEFEYEFDDMARSSDPLMPSPEQSLAQMWSGPSVVEELKRLVLVSN